MLCEFLMNRREFFLMDQKRTGMTQMLYVETAKRKDRNRQVETYTSLANFTISWFKNRLQAWCYGIATIGNTVEPLLTDTPE